MAIVPSVRGPNYGAQTAQQLAAFDANAAQRRLADAETLKAVLSNAKDAQGVFGAGTLANLASVGGGLSRENFDQDYMTMSDRLNQAQRNADVVNTLAQASERMPDHIVSPADIASPPGFGANMTPYVSTADRADLVGAQNLGNLSVDPNRMTFRIPEGYPDAGKMVTFDKFSELAQYANMYGVSPRDLVAGPGAEGTHSIGTGGKGSAATPGAEVQVGTERRDALPQDNATVDMTGGASDEPSYEGTYSDEQTARVRATLPDNAKDSVKVYILPNGDGVAYDTRTGTELYRGPMD